MSMQVRGAGIVANSLNVRGEEICIKLDQAKLPRTKTCNRTYLIWCVADADIKVWEFGLHNISEYHFQALLGRGSLETLRHFCRHSRVQFHRDNLFGLFEYLCC